MRQYFEMKAKHKDALLLFRVGDFYETFGEDAVKASQALGIVLTKRNNGGSDIELAGFPHHSLDVYLPKLVRHGYRVAICEQLEKPSKEKKIVKRGITDLVTPGIGTDDNLLEQKENNYLASIFVHADKSMGCAFLELSTGDFVVYEGHESEVVKLINTYFPREIIHPKTDEKYVRHILGESFYLYGIDDWIFQVDYGREKLLDFFKVQNLKGYSIESLSLGQTAAGAILHYLDNSEQKNLQHINKIRTVQLDNYVWLDQFTIRNLELIQSNHPSGIPLIQILDRTSTPMGGRLMRKWILLPLTDIKQIRQRLSIVESFVNNQVTSEAFDSVLSQMNDLERIIAKVSLRKINPREVFQLMQSLKKIPELKDLLGQVGLPDLDILIDQLDDVPKVCEKIEKAIKDDPPFNLSKGGVIAEAYDPELDELRSLISNSKAHLEKLLTRETEKTGITNLKVGFNNVFGYYFEVTNKYKDQGLVPDNWTRKQTLTNAERYISEELKDLESQILGAQDKILALEERLFDELVDWLSHYIETIQQNAAILSKLDCLNAFAKVALRNSYRKPEVNESHRLRIVQGRHPVIEAHLPLGESYIPNDLDIDNREEQILLITGPNMSGKSAILRQTALISLLAQMGSFVPADEAEIGIIDRVFTRVGASDNISSGESTFMVEMIETASILNNLSSRSLILLDEIGRGTSTYDGISIAWSIVEFLHEDEYAPKTLFATHYHELSQLADKYGRICNYNVTTKEIGDRIIFLRKLEKGSTNQSFGIQVAQMSGLPRAIILRAKQILESLQQHSIDRENRKNEVLEHLEVQDRSAGQLLMFAPDPGLQAIEKELIQMDVNTMTPIECMMKLNELARKAKEAVKN